MPEPEIGQRAQRTVQTEGWPPRLETGFLNERDIDKGRAKQTKL
ncbi:hypothetical protein [Paenibacillus sp. CECT 9249]|nr:hypothetical protein [Paenibacillus sp. CECT 9249]